MVPQLISVGASLGGLDAMRTLLGRLPGSFACPLAIVQHRSSDADKGLIELLGARTALRVVEPEDKDPILPGYVYVAPPAYHLVVERGFFSLSLDPPVSYARPAIDVLFESMADSYGRAGVAVMLTGSNDDGAAGAAAVKAMGGVVLVQDPTTALAPAAPQAVLKRCAVDGAFDVEHIAERLVHLCTPEKLGT